MSLTTTPPRSPRRGHANAQAIENSLTAGQLPRFAPLFILLGSLAVTSALFGILAAAGGSDFNIAAAVFFGVVLYGVLIWVISRIVEGNRKAKDRLVTALVATAFTIALLPLISVAFTTLVNGLPRFDLQYLTESMRNVVGPGGGALHAIVGTLLITGAATVISVPVGLLTAIYLVEYGQGG